MEKVKVHLHNFEWEIVLDILKLERNSIKRHRLIRDQEDMNRYERKINNIITRIKLALKY